MARRKGSRNRGLRAKPRTPYQTYSDWYDKYTKGNKSKLFDKKLTKEEFEYWYKRAKAKGYANPARKVAMEQEYVERSFERGLRKKYGDKNMPDLSTKEARKQAAQDYINELMGQGMSEEDAWEEFREYFY